MLKKKPPKFFEFFKDRYFVMGGSTDVNVGVVWEPSAGFLKHVVS